MIVRVPMRVGNYWVSEVGIRETMGGHYLVFADVNGKRMTLVTNFAIFDAALAKVEWLLSDGNLLHAIDFRKE